MSRIITVLKSENVWPALVVYAYVSTFGWVMTYLLHAAYNMNFWAMLAIFELVGNGMFTWAVYSMSRREKQSVKKFDEQFARDWPQLANRLSSHATDDAK